ncbi:avidin-like [Heteronotia binoei]|uniref:avidin-like n=1 Tax=Heteronotia binoei TaxID=13085 RepID=UPI002930FC2C|nr:avidin-like [Heteronotia binoei]
MVRLSLPAASALLAALLLASSAAADASSPTGENPGGTKCSLAGMWVNELGSRMVLSAPDDGGAFSGSYLSAVTASNAAITESPVLGVQHQPDQSAQPTFSFVVLWRFTASTAAFVGQCFVDEEGAETLETLWLLRQEVPARGQDWQATRVGKNVFTRIK